MEDMKQKTKRNKIRFGRHAKIAGLALSVGFSAVVHGECPCETQSTEGLQLAYESSLAQNNAAMPAPARALQASSSNSDAPKYLDPSLPIEDRVNDLLPRLTLEEKVIQLSDDWGSKGIPRLK